MLWLAVPSLAMPAAFPLAMRALQARGIFQHEQSVLPRPTFGDKAASCSVCCIATVAFCDRSPRLPRNSACISFPVGHSSLADAAAQSSRHLAVLCAQHSCYDSPFVTLLRFAFSSGLQSCVPKLVVLSPTSRPRSFNRCDRLTITFLS